MALLNIAALGLSNVPYNWQEKINNYVHVVISVFLKWFTDCCLKILRISNNILVVFLHRIKGIFPRRFKTCNLQAQMYTNNFEYCLNFDNSIKRSCKVKKTDDECYKK